ncbi:MAG: hypothetical protein AAGE80_08360 [Pseudomonadota bacterium]
MLRSAAAIALILTTFQPASALDPATGTPILTIGGTVAEPNRGPFDPFRDAFLEFNERRFEAAAEFDRAMLSALPQMRIRANAEAFPAAITADGPSLSDVLKAAGVAESATITLLAFDGYAIDLTAEDRAATDFILAHTIDGRPLGPGQRGPLWLLSDTGDGLASEAQEAAWIWSVFYIEAQ